jgi:DNA-binding NarL/FixJ family response regulator
LLEREHRYRVLGEAANGREAVILTRYHSPDVVILDFNLPLLSGIETAREIAAQSQSRTIFVSGRVDEEYVLKAFEAGGAGFVFSDALQDDLCDAVRVVAIGGRFISPSIIRELVTGCNGRSMDRELRLGDLDEQFLCWLARGWDTADMAAVLNASPERIDHWIDETRDRSLRAGIPSAILRLIDRKVVT